MKYLFLIALVSTSLLLSGCRTVGGKKVGGKSAYGGQIGGLRGGSADLVEARNNSVFFGFDSSKLDSEQSESLSKIGEAIKANPNCTQVRIEGNCDARGTVDHNMGLGARRAEAAKRELAKNSSIASGRISTISNGKNKATSSTDESVMAQERRADVLCIEG